MSHYEHAMLVVTAVFIEFILLIKRIIIMAHANHYDAGIKKVLNKVKGKILLKVETTDEDMVQLTFADKTVMRIYPAENPLSDGLDVCITTTD